MIDEPTADDINNFLSLVSQSLALSLNKSDIMHPYIVNFLQNGNLSNFISIS
jgi:hypothetical protein